MELKRGDRAPEFCLPDQNNKQVCLEDFKGEWLLIYYYPKDDTPGCTKEACSMRDNMANFNRMGARVIGVSKDSVKSHKKFEAKYGLNYPLLADEGAKVIKKYGMWKPKKFMGREFLGTVRSSVLVDGEGKIAKIYENVKPEGHAQEVMADLERL